MKIGMHQDKPLVVNVLSKAFDNNLSINYIVKQDKRRTQRIKFLMDYCFEICLMKGRVFLSDDQNACALILHPEEKGEWLKSIMLNASLAFNVIGISRVSKVLNREKKIKEYQPDHLFFYLWFIGVDPQVQGKGIGRHLLQEIFQYYKKDQKPFYLETSNLQNLPRYKSFGFNIINEIDLGYKLYQMVRN